MATLSTTAWVLHDLGLAAGFGGNLFGQLALNPAVRSLESKHERGKVTPVAWDRYRAVTGTSLAAIAGPWLVGRTILSGREVSQASRNLTLLKDILVVGAVAGGVGALVVGGMLDREQEQSGYAPIEEGGEPSRDTPPRVARLQRTVNTLGTINLVFQAAVLATTTILAMKAGQSGKWGFFSRLLP